MELEEFNSILIPINLTLNENLIKLRKNYKLFAISHFINLFKRHINFEFDLVELELDLDGTRPNSCVPTLLGKLLNTLANDRNVNSTNWLNALRRQYARRQPESNPLVEWVEIVSTNENNDLEEEGKVDEKNQVALSNDDDNDAIKIDKEEESVVGNGIGSSGLTGEEKKALEVVVVVEKDDSEGIKMDVDVTPLIESALESPILPLSTPSTSLLEIPAPIVPEEEEIINPVASTSTSLNNNNNNNNNSTSQSPKPSPFIKSDKKSVVGGGGEEGETIIEEDNVLWKEVEVSWESVDLETKIDAIYNVCEWHMQETERFRRLLKGPDEVNWRIEPLGSDSQNNKYYYSMDDQRLWVQHPPPLLPGQQLKLKMKSKKYLNKNNSEDEEEEDEENKSSRSKKASTSKLPINSNSKLSTSKSKSRAPPPIEKVRSAPKDRSLPSTSTSSSSKKRPRPSTTSTISPSSLESNPIITNSRLRSVIVPVIKQKLRGSRSRVGRAEIWEEIPESLLAEWKEPELESDDVDNTRGKDEEVELEVEVEEEEKRGRKGGKRKKIEVEETKEEVVVAKEGEEESKPSTLEPSVSLDESTSSELPKASSSTSTIENQKERNESVTSSILSEVSDFEEDEEDFNKPLLVLDTNEEDDDYIPDEEDEVVIPEEDDEEEGEEEDVEMEVEREIEEGEDEEVPIPTGEIGMEVEEGVGEKKKKSPVVVPTASTSKSTFFSESIVDPSTSSSSTSVLATAEVKVSVEEELPPMELSMMKWEKDYWAERARCDKDGFIEWEAVCVTVEEWELFIEKFAKTKNQKERALRDLVRDEAMVYVYEAHQAKEEKRISDIATMNRKRSSRIAIKESAQEEDARLSNERAETSSRLSRASRHKIAPATTFNGYDETGSNNSGASGSGSGGPPIVQQETREERLKKREEEKLAKRLALEAAAIEEIRLAEREAAILANGGIVPPGMETPEELAAMRLQAEKEAKKNLREEKKKSKEVLKKKAKVERAAAKKRALKEEANNALGGVGGEDDLIEYLPEADEEPWFLECEICLKSGWNLDDGSAVISCDRCDDWQHLDCHVQADELAGRPSVDYNSIDFYCAKCTNEPYRKLPNRLPPSNLSGPYQSQQYVPVELPTPKGKKGGKNSSMASSSKGGIGEFSSPGNGNLSNSTPTGKEKRKYKPRAPKVGEDGLPLPPPPAKKQKKEKVFTPKATTTARAAKAEAYARAENSRNQSSSNSYQAIAGPSYSNGQQQQPQYQQQQQQQHQQQQSQYQSQQSQEAPRPRVPTANEPPLDYPALVKLITANPILVNDLPATYQAHFAALLNIPVPYPDTRALQFAPLPLNNNNSNMNGSGGYSNGQQQQQQQQRGQVNNSSNLQSQSQGYTPSTSSSNSYSMQQQLAPKSPPITFSPQPQPPKVPLQVPVQVDQKDEIEKAPGEGAIASGNGN